MKRRALVRSLQNGHAVGTKRSRVV